MGEAGYDAFTNVALMGHSDIHTTARYVRATERMKREAVEAAMLGAQKVTHKLPDTKSGQVHWPLQIIVSIGSGGRDRTVDLGIMNL